MTGSPVDHGRPLLEMRGIDKHFPGVHALKGVDLAVRTGEIHALVGENGAGKSTLMHILAGVYQPDAGAIGFDGQDCLALANEREAQQLGIAIVFQERSLFPPLSVAENVFAGRQPAYRWGQVNRSALKRETQNLLDQLGLNLNPDALVSELSPAQQQMVEIAKALSLRAKLLILDEPTAALTETETRSLFSVIRRLKAQQVGIIHISHRLDEIFQIADRVTVLKDGEEQGTFAVSETTPADLIAKMVGRNFSWDRAPAERANEPGAVILEVRNIRDDDSNRHRRPFLEGVGLVARAGEIVVLAGLAGAGRTELAMTIFGGRRVGAGEIFVAGEPVVVRSPADAIEAGIGYLPEDRKEAGLFLEMSLADNVAAAQLRRFGDWWFGAKQQAAVAEEYRRTLRIVCRSIAQPVQELSGGNQQKAVLARWLLVNPKVLIVDEPTRGIDVGAKAEVHALLRQLARNGTAVIVISSELPEVLALADRILVLRDGRIAGELSRSEATEEKILHCASMGDANH